jgi:hypothetical protein
MKIIFNKLATVLLFVAISLNFSSCNNDDLASVTAAPLAKSRALVNSCGCSVVGLDTLPQLISADRTLSCDTTYILTQKTYVINGATLTIPAGTTIKGVKNSTPELASALIITKGSKLIANGEPCCPIVFTSNEAEPAVGDWGGVVLLGRAPINQDSTTVTIEGIDLPSLPTGVDIHYGGNISNDNSGSLTYVRVEYAGAAISDANELNSFTFGGAGSGTTLGHLQAYYGADDAFEFFGGTVNAKYLLSTAANDDAFDFDFGYRGKLQFLVAVLDPAAPYSANANGIECDNDGSGTTAQPYTRPVISNLTVVGTSNGATSGGGTVLYGAHFRRSTRFVLRNSVLYGYKGKTGTQVVINLDGSTVYSKLGRNLSYTLSNDSSYMAYNVIGLISGATAYNPATPVNVGDSVRTTTAMTLRYPLNTLYYFDASEKGLSPTGNPALNGADFTGLYDGFFDTNPTYKGGVSDGNYWITDCWVNKDDFPFY